MSNDDRFVRRVYICGPTIYKYDGVLFEWCWKARN